MTERIYAPIEEFGRTWTHYALSTRVLIVAKAEVDIGDWAAYIDAVPGKQHTKEAEEVLHSGTKIPYWLAKKLFPTMDKLYTWRP